MKSLDIVQRIREAISTSSTHSEKLAYDQLLPSRDASQSSGAVDEMDVEISSLHKSRRSRIKMFAVFLAKFSLVCFAIWGVVNTGRRTINISIAGSGPRSCSCGGTTVAEAKRQGCKFTPLAISWLPPHCIDQDLADEFDAAAPNGEWEYWADLNATKALTREEVGMLADTWGAVFYTTQEWHVMHCMYTWRKHYRSQFTGVTIEARSNGIDHIKHCEGIVRDRAPLLKIWTMAGIELNADLT